MTALGAELREKLILYFNEKILGFSEPDKLLNSDGRLHALNPPAIFFSINNHFTGSIFLPLAPESTYPFPILSDANYDAAWDKKITEAAAQKDLNKIGIGYGSYQFDRDSSFPCLTIWLPPDIRPTAFTWLDSKQDSLKDFFRHDVIGQLNTFNFIRRDADHFSPELSLVWLDLCQIIKGNADTFNNPDLKGQWYGALRTTLRGSDLAQSWNNAAPIIAKRYSTISTLCCALQDGNDPIFEPIAERIKDLLVAQFPLLASELGRDPAQALRSLRQRGLAQANKLGYALPA